MNLDHPIRKIGPIFTRLRVQDLQHFDQETWRQDKLVTHRNTQCIFLRHWKYRSQRLRELRDYPLLSVYREPLEGILDELSGHYDYQTYSAVITNLRARKSIPRHVDDGYMLSNSHRIHIPIRTNPQAIFHCGRESINMKLDHAYEIGNTSHEHSVDNNGKEDRYHLIVDLFPEPLSS